MTWNRGAKVPEQLRELIRVLPVAACRRDRVGRRLSFIELIAEFWGREPKFMEPPTAFHISQTEPLKGGAV